MNQTRIESLVEALANVVIGFVVSFVGQLAVFPAVGLRHIDLSQNLAIGLCFTAISIVRSYALRRWFNARLHRAAQRIASRIES